MTATPKAVHLQPLVEMRLVAELPTEPTRAMACYVCIMFHLLPGQSRHIPKGAEVAVPKSRHGRAAKRRSFCKGTGACEVGGVRNPKDATREFCRPTVRRLPTILNIRPEAVDIRERHWSICSQVHPRKR